MESWTGRTIALAGPADIGFWWTFLEASFGFSLAGGVCWLLVTIARGVRDGDGLEDEL
jgi:hypothetical protein